MPKGNIRRIYLAFEFERDAGRRSEFMAQAKKHCVFELEDKSLPAAAHSKKWRREAREHMKSCHVLIVLLGQDTHNAPGVLDELSLAGQLGLPVVQLMPKSRKYDLVSDQSPVCPFRWTRVNEMLRNPRAFSS